MTTFPPLSYLGVPTMLSEIEALPSIKLGDYTLQFELGEATAATKEVAARELRETPERQQEATQELKRLLEGKCYTEAFSLAIIIIASKGTQADQGQSLFKNDSRPNLFDKFQLLDSINDVMTYHLV